jgi:uncharacterized protein YkwD
MRLSHYLAVVLIFGLALSTACSDDEPTDQDQRCPPGAEYDGERDRCIGLGGEADASDAARDVGGDASASDDADVSTPPDTNPPNHGDADSGDNDDSGSPDGGEADADAASVDAGPDTDDTGPEDTGGADTGPLPECGANVWDDTHDGTNPWDDPIDCAAIAASWDCDLADDEQRVLELVNQMRSQEQECGSTSYSAASPVQMNPELRCAARMHAWDQQGRGYYDHTTPEGLSPGDRATNAGFQSGNVAENIFMINASPEATVQGWMDSPGHCANIMKSHFSKVGVGRYGGHYVLMLYGAGWSY